MVFNDDIMRLPERALSTVCHQGQFYDHSLHRHNRHRDIQQ